MRMSAWGGGGGAVPCSVRLLPCIITYDQSFYLILMFCYFVLRREGNRETTKNGIEM